MLSLFMTEIVSTEDLRDFVDETSCTGALVLDNMRHSREANSRRLAVQRAVRTLSRHWRFTRKISFRVCYLL